MFSDQEKKTFVLQRPTFLQRILFNDDASFLSVKFDALILQQFLRLFFATKFLRLNFVTIFFVGFHKG